VPLEILAVPGHRDLVRSKLCIQGEPFFVEQDGDIFYIRHEHWSLLGSGASFFAAYADLFSEARELAPVLAALPLSSLDQEALRLSQFVSRIA
jgi:hypothetical protein